MKNMEVAPAKIRIRTCCFKYETVGIKQSKIGIKASLWWVCPRKKRKLGVEPQTLGLSHLGVHDMLQLPV